MPAGVLVVIGAAGERQHDLGPARFDGGELAPQPVGRDVAQRPVVAAAEPAQRQVEGPDGNAAGERRGQRGPADGGWSEGIECGCVERERFTGVGVQGVCGIARGERDYCRGAEWRSNAADAAAELVNPRHARALLSPMSGRRDTVGAAGEGRRSARPSRRPIEWS